MSVQDRRSDLTNLGVLGAIVFAVDGRKRRLANGMVWMHRPPQRQRIWRRRGGGSITSRTILRPDAKPTLVLGGECRCRCGAPRRLILWRLSASEGYANWSQSAYCHVATA